MRAASLREFIEFLELRTTQGVSGEYKKEYVSVYKCRAYLRKSAPSYDKDGVDAMELFKGVSRTFQIRRSDKVNEKQVLVYAGDRYEILMIQPNADDNSLLIQVRKINK
ncbi:phage head completion protein [Bacteroides sedimenti]|uniref:Head-tail adaptor protein n=1 Tax=Bacteroides sedimenti TaxID=2136147 RepID=A0ABN6Z7L3_9BACE